MLRPESQFPHLQTGDKGAVVSLKRCMHLKSFAKYWANGKKDYNQRWLFLLVETFKLVQEKKNTASMLNEDISLNEAPYAPSC